MLQIGWQSTAIAFIKANPITHNKNPIARCLRSFIYNVINDLPVHRSPNVTR
jgi:hypothetical protein